MFERTVHWQSFPSFVNMSHYYIHKVWIRGILQSDWFSIATIRILAHNLLAEKNKMTAQTEFPTFCEREKLLAFYSLYSIKNTMKKQIVHRLANEFLKFKMVKNI